jgi:hypothetical protein
MRNINTLLASMVVVLKQSLTQMALVENKIVPKTAQAKP